MAQPTRNDNGKYPAYAWPGGYPLIYICADGGTLCPECANGEHGSGASTATDAPKDWRMEAVDVHWEGEAVQCDHCGKSIESAYGVPDESEKENP